jgi:hypothetical protein
MIDWIEYFFIYKNKQIYTLKIINFIHHVINCERFYYKKLFFKNL